MTSKQERKLRMYRMVIHLLIRENDVVKDLPHFMEKFEEFCGLNDKIEETVQLQIVPITGIASDKKKKRAELVNDVLGNALKLKILALNNNNMRLFDQADLSRTDIEDRRDLDLKTLAEIIYSETDLRLEELKEYRISVDTQKDFRKKIDAFYDMIAKPRSAIAERSAETMKLAGLIGEAYQVLLDIDIIMGIIMFKKPEFYSSYKFARKLVYTRAGRLALRACAREARSGAAVQGAVFTFIFNVTGNESNTKHPDIVKKSSVKGGLAIHNMPEGTYTVVVKKPGYQDKTININIVKGERSELVVELEK